MGTVDIEGLREAFKDPTVHIAVGRIDKLEMAEDRSLLRCLVTVFPEMRQIVARMTWESVGPESGILMPPQPDDMVLIALAEGDDDQAFVIRRLTSKVDKLPVQASQGHLFMRPVNGKKSYLASDTKIVLSKGGEEDPIENIPLGQELKAMLSELITLVIEHKHMSSAPGAPTGPPTNAADLENVKTTKVDNETILSQLAFVEK